MMEAVSSAFVRILISLILCIAFSSQSTAQQWRFRRPKGALKVVDMESVSMSVIVNYAEGLVSLAPDNNWVPCLAEDWTCDDKE